MYVTCISVITCILCVLIAGDRDGDDRPSRGSTSREHEGSRGESGERESSRRQGGPPTMNAWSRGKPHSLGGEPMKKYEEPAVPVS